MINGSAQRIAEEMDVADKYIYRIQGGTETDPFAKFAALYAACVRAGCDVTHWLNRLDAIRAKYHRMDAGCIETETAKVIKESSDVAIAAVENKTLEQRLIETNQLIAQAEIQRKAIITKIAAGENVKGKFPRAA